jgi:Protein of unknown function (DUF2726)
MPNVAFKSPTYWKRKFLFSEAERSFWDILRRLVPDHTVFAKVQLGEIIAASKGDNSWRPNDQREDFDFVVCDATLAPVMAVELDNSSPAQAENKASHEFVDAVPVVRIPAKRSYLLDEVRRLILPHVHTSGPSC